MKTLNSIISNYKTSASKIEKEAIELTGESDDFFEDGNTNQLLRGRQPNDSLIIPEYRNSLYAEFKQRITPNTARPKFTPNLKLTGDFHQSINYEKSSTGFNIKGNDKHGLQKKYGEILGVSKETKKAFKREVLEPELRGFVKKALT